MWDTYNTSAFGWAVLFHVLGRIVAFFMLPGGSVDETLIYFICMKTTILRLLCFNQAIVQATYLSVFYQLSRKPEISGLWLLIGMVCWLWHQVFWLFAWRLLSLGVPLSCNRTLFISFNFPSISHTPTRTICPGLLCVTLVVCGWWDIKAQLLTTY